MTTLKPYFALCRIYIALFSAGSAAVGWMLFRGRPDAAVSIPGGAVFLLACGASALNQIQERTIDAAMERTRKRPLPSGLFSPKKAVALAMLLIVAGLGLAAAAGAVPFALSLISLFWYNGLYTYLKRATAFASVPGAVVGMIPPAIGWTSAGGGLLDGRLGIVCVLFFLWQIPHFWLLLLKHGEEYERAGLPSLTRVMPKQQIARITFAWIVAASLGSLALPLYGSLRSPLACFSLVPLAAWVIGNGKTLITRHSMPYPAPRLFRTINLYLLLLMTLLTLDSVLLRLP